MMTAVAPKQLEEGNIGDLHKLYGGLGSGRLVIVGGSGKSGVAVLLILALQYREQLTEADRVKVPVMFTMCGWEPDAQQIQDWLAARLRQTHPQFTGRDGDAKARILLAKRQISVILDGLDEISEDLRPVALRGLNPQATFRLIVLSRLDEMAAAAIRVHLEGAAAVELQSIDADTADNYLTRVQLDPPPPGWKELTEHLLRDPVGPVAKALSTPLTLTLVRDTYREHDDVSEILDLRTPAGAAASREDIVGHLLDRVLPAAYTQGSGLCPLTYDLQTARHALCQIAAQMNRDGTRDLRWWLIPSWMPRRPRAAITAFVGGAAIGVVFGALSGSANEITGMVTGIVSGVAGGVLILRTAGKTNHVPQRMGPVRWRLLISPDGLTRGLSAGVAAGILTIHVGGGVGIGITVALSVWVVMMIAARIDDVLGRPGVNQTTSPTPLTVWRNDWTYSLVTGVVTAAGMGTAAGILAGLVDGSTVGVIIGIAIFLGFGTMAALASRAWPMSLTFVQLSALWHIPVRIMRLLEGAAAKCPAYHRAGLPVPACPVARSTSGAGTSYQPIISQSPKLIVLSLISELSRLAQGIGVLT